MSNNSFNDQKEFIDYLMLGNIAKHISADIIIKLDMNGDILFIGNALGTNIIEVNASNHKQWVRNN